MDWAVIAQLGSAAGAVAVTYMFLKFGREDDRENRLMMENHLSHQTKVLQNLVDQTNEHRSRTEK